MTPPEDEEIDAEAEAPPSEDVDAGEAVEAAAPLESSEPSVEESAEGPARAHVIAFAAGRGGTGRSLLAANVAIYLAQTGKKVVAIDADPAGGSLHLLLGTPRPPRGFGEFLRARVEGL